MYMTPEELEDWAQAEEDEEEVYKGVAQLMQECKNIETSSILEFAQQATLIFQQMGQCLPKLLETRSDILDDINHRFQSESGETWKNQ